VTQIGNVANIERLDSLDRQKLDPLIKLVLLCEEARVAIGRDPRAENSGISIVGRPRVILNLMLDMLSAKHEDEIMLERPVILGSNGGDVVGSWLGAKIIVRCNVVDDRLWAVEDTKIPRSSMNDRRLAAELRMHGHRGTLDVLLDGDD
jgi:hypothetical protein